MEDIRDIKRILEEVDASKEKGTLTGRELGRAVVRLLAISHWLRLRNKERPEAAEIVGNLNELESVIKSDKDIDDYRGYMSIWSWLISNWNMALAHQQQAQLQYRTLSSYLLDALLAEDMERYIHFISHFVQSTSPDPGNDYEEMTREMKKQIEDYSLAAFFPEHEAFETNDNITRNATNTMGNSYYYVNGFNRALDMIAEQFQIQEITSFNVPMDLFESNLENYNGLRAQLRDKLKAPDYQTAERAKEKRKVLRKYFPSVKWKTAYKIPGDNLEMAKAILKNGYTAFNGENSTLFLALLCSRQTGGADGED
jgi:hypothetical protein